MTQQSAGLPPKVDARKCAVRQETLEGQVPLAGLARLQDAVQSSSESALVEITCGRDELGNFTLDGHIRCEVEILCQRCLGPIPHAIDAEFHWGIIRSEEQAKNLPKSLDPVIQGEEKLDLYAALEDEILLHLPFVTYHEEDCVPRENLVFGDEAEAAPDEDRENPFKVLEQLKGKQGK